MLQFFVAAHGYEDLYRAVQAGRISHLQVAYEIWRVMLETWCANFVRPAIFLNIGRRADACRRDSMASLAHVDKGAREVGRS